MTLSSLKTCFDRFSACTWFNYQSRPDHKIWFFFNVQIPAPLSLIVVFQEGSERQQQTAAIDEDILKSHLKLKAIFDQLQSDKQAEHEQSQRQKAALMEQLIEVDFNLSQLLSQPIDTSSPPPPPPLPTPSSPPPSPSSLNGLFLNYQLKVATDILDSVLEEIDDDEETVTGPPVPVPVPVTRKTYANELSPGVLLNSSSLLEELKNAFDKAISQTETPIRPSSLNMRSTVSSSTSDRKERDQPTVTS